MSSNQFKAVMFDLDGTLADTLEAIAFCGNHAFTRLGRKPFEIDKYRFLAGQGLERLVADGLGDVPDDMIAKGMNLFREHYAEHGDRLTKPFPGILELLAELKKRGLPTAVLSNKPHANTVRCVDTVFAGQDFACVIGHRDGTELKPDPASATEMTEQLDIPPDQWIYVGDTAVDMQTGTRAGMYPVGVLWGFRERAELEEHGAKLIVSEPAEILQLLD